MSKKKAHRTMSKKKAHRTKDAERAYPIKICDQPGCQFRGKQTQAGICFDAEGELISYVSLDAHEKEILAEMANMKRREGRNYLRSLEAYYLTAMLNWSISQDENIRLRRDLAVLRNRQAKPSKGKTL